MTSKTCTISKSRNNKKNKNDAKNAISKAPDNLHLMISVNPLEDDDETTSSWKVEVVAPTTTQGDETDPQIHLTEAIASNVGIASPMPVSSTTLGRDATFIPFGRIETQGEVVQTLLEEDMPIGLSTLTHEVC